MMDTGVPDFGTITEEQISLPFRDEKFLKFSYSDPILSGYQVIVAADSHVPEVSGTDRRLPERDEPGRLTTIIARFPRCILPEVNTHRVFARNSASSRARSVKSTITDVMMHPYIPLFTRNQKGMSGRFLDGEDRQRAVREWLRARDRAVAAVIRLLMGDMIDESVPDDRIARYHEKFLKIYYDKVYLSDDPDSRALSVHKQDVNRLIEPFMWHEAVITSSFWSNFLSLRTDTDHAQPGISAMAFLVRKALLTSVPKGTWIHLPFVDPADVPEDFTSFSQIRDIALRSATECARVSYRDRSGETMVSNTTTLGEKLLADRHMSPFEHIAFSRESYMKFSEDEGLPCEDWRLRGNLDSRYWIQLRKILENTTDRI